MMITNTMTRTNRKRTKRSSAAAHRSPLFDSVMAAVWHRHPAWPGPGPARSATEHAEADNGWPAGAGTSTLPNTGFKLPNQPSHYLV